MNYERLLTYGDVIPLRISCDPAKIVQEIEPFEFHQYNKSKPSNPRVGLSITSYDGELDGWDLDSLGELTVQKGEVISELDFKKPTKVAFLPEVRKIIEPFIGHLGRCHFLSLKTGGYFPPHRDDRNHTDNQEVYRVIVPICDCSPPHLYWIHDREQLNLVAGRAYFINTNKEHCLFSYSNNNLFIVLNIECNPETLNILFDNFLNI